MTTAVLVDDELLLTQHLERQLRMAWPELVITGRASNGREALALIDSARPDVVFLDIRMPGQDGLQIASRLPQDVHIVFVTAYDEYAIAAFEHATVDYLLKPVTEERLATTVKKLKRQLEGDTNITAERGQLTALVEQLLARAPERVEYIQWLRVGANDVTELVPVGDVVYLRSDTKYTSVYTATREYLLRMTLKELEQQLDPSVFWRIHRSILVNANDIASATRDLRGRYQLQLKRRAETLRSSQSYGHLFRHM